MLSVSELLNLMMLVSTTMLVTELMNLLVSTCIFSFICYREYYR